MYFPDETLRRGRALSRKTGTPRATTLQRHTKSRDTSGVHASFEKVADLVIDRKLPEDVTNRHVI